jgi:hypothetical protein
MLRRRKLPVNRADSPASGARFVRLRLMPHNFMVAKLDLHYYLCHW